MAHQDRRPDGHEHEHETGPFKSLDASREPLPSLEPLEPGYEYVGDSPEHVPTKTSDDLTEDLFTTAAPSATAAEYPEQRDINGDPRHLGGLSPGKKAILVGTALLLGGALGTGAVMLTLGAEQEPAPAESASPAPSQEASSPSASPNTHSSGPAVQESASAPPVAPGDVIQAPQPSRAPDPHRSALPTPSGSTQQPTPSHQPVPSRDPAQKSPPAPSAPAPPNPVPSLSAPNPPAATPRGAGHSTP